MEKLDFNKLKPFLLRNPVIRQNLFIGLTFILMGDSLKDLRDVRIYLKK